MNIYHQKVIDFLGLDWFESNWEKFRQIRNKFSRATLSKEVGLLELSLHPLLRLVFKHQDRLEDGLDFTKIPKGSSADFILSHLGRDLQHLEREINQRGNKIKEDLLNPRKFESHRFNLLVAAGWRLLGFKVEFVPSSSSAGKTADLFVGKDQFEYYIENKQANQHESDKDRYDFLCEIADILFNLLRLKKQTDVFINIEVVGSIANSKKWIEKSIRRYIWKNERLPSGKQLKIVISSVSTKPAFLKILQAGGHFQKVPVFTNTEDSIFASDPVTKSVILVNKNISEDLPTRIFRLLDDANKKEKKGKKLLVYFDIEMGVSDWTDQLADKIMNRPAGELTNIDGFVICQTPIQYIPDGGKVVTQIRPKFNLLGSVDKLDGTPETLEIFGYQGHTGMDGYLLPEFLNPI